MESGGGGGGGGVEMRSDTVSYGIFRETVYIFFQNSRIFCFLGRISPCETEKALFILLVLIYCCFLFILFSIPSTSSGSHKLYIYKIRGILPLHVVPFSSFNFLLFSSPFPIFFQHNVMCDLKNVSDLCLLI